MEKIDAGRNWMKGKQTGFIKSTRNKDINKNRKLTNKSPWFHENLKNIF